MADLIKAIVMHFEHVRFDAKKSEWFLMAALTSRKMFQYRFMSFLHTSLALFCLLQHERNVSYLLNL